MAGNILQNVRDTWIFSLWVQIQAFMQLSRLINNNLLSEFKLEYVFEHLAYVM